MNVHRSTLDLLNGGLAKTKNAIKAWRGEASASEVLSELKAAQRYLAEAEERLLTHTGD